MVPESSALTIPNFIHIQVGCFFDYFLYFSLTVHQGFLNNFGGVQKHTLSSRVGASLSVCGSCQWSPLLRTETTLIFAMSTPDINKLHACNQWCGGFAFHKIKNCLVLPSLIDYTMQCFIAWYSYIVALQHIKADCSLSRDAGGHNFMFPDY